MSTEGQKFYDEGYRAGVDAAHADVRGWVTSGHPADCNCDTCITVRSFCWALAVAAAGEVVALSGLPEDRAVAVWHAVEASPDALAAVRASPPGGIAAVILDVCRVVQESGGVIAKIIPRDWRA